jgi:uncharacterized LabA/DUF88 family protein
LVKFFSTKRPAKEPKAAAPSATPAAATSKSSSVTADAAEEPAKKPATRTRRAPARPPRRDWAAEAAAAPIDAPSPAPNSLATSPADDTDAAAAPAKRRRGTRGGRGRKKPGTISADGEVPAVSAVEIAHGEPKSLEEIVAQQSTVLESFARDVSSTLKLLQTSVSELRQQIAERRGGVTSHPRVGIFVDVPNLIYAAERRNISIDFGRVIDYFTRDRELVRACAYAPISDDPAVKLETQRFVHHFVGHPYRIVTKPLKRFADGSMKANFDIELAIDMLTMSERLDVVVLMSGDGDFRRVVELIASRGVRVEVVAFGEAASTELKTAADLYVDVGQHLDDFKALK